MSNARSLARLFAVEPENDWRNQAACRGLDPDLFFSLDTFETKPDRDDREIQAKAVCAGCPVRVECLEYALQAGERYGIWGGLDEIERRAVQRRRATADRAERAG